MLDFWGNIRYNKSNHSEALQMGVLADAPVVQGKDPV
jgi:hypothetical protein